MLLERGQVISGKAFDAVRARHVAVAGAPEGERIDQRLAQDHFPRRAERRSVPHATMRPWQIQVQRGSGAQVVIQLAPVDFRHLPALRDHRDHERAAQVLVS